MRRGMVALHAPVEGPRHGRRLVDATNNGKVYPVECNCPCALALEAEEDGEEQEGWAMLSLDPELIQMLAGDPSICMPKDQSSAMIAVRLGQCDNSCLL